MFDSSPKPGRTAAGLQRRAAKAAPLPLTATRADEKLIDDVIRPKPQTFTHPVLRALTLHENPGTEVWEPARPHDLVVIQLRDRRPRLLTDLTGQRRAYDAAAGSFLVIPPGMACWRRTELAGGHLLHLTISLPDLGTLLDDDLDPVQLRPRIGWIDPNIGALSSRLADLIEGDAGSSPYPQSLAVVVAVEAVRALIALSPIPRPVGAGRSMSIVGHHGGLSPKVMRLAEDFLLEDVSRDVTLKEIADLVGLSVSHFCRAFKRSTGQPPHAWLTSKRIERAQTLMMADRTIGLVDVALSVGFGGHAAFSTAFRRVTGTSPSAWRRERQA